MWERLSAAITMIASESRSFWKPVKDELELFRYPHLLGYELALFFFPTHELDLNSRHLPNSDYI
jgi:hypothetical protein